MAGEFERQLSDYADMILRAGLNFRPGQRLLMAEPYDQQGVALEAAPLVRIITELAYRRGARFVDVIWNDGELQKLRQSLAPQDSFEEFSKWKSQALQTAAERGDALLFLMDARPETLTESQATMGDLIRRTAWQHFGPVAELLTRGGTNWTVAPVPTPTWAKKVFPKATASDQLMQLWQCVFGACRLADADPVNAWQRHLDALQRRARWLTERAYSSLRFAAPGTDLTIGLVREHRWCTARMSTSKGRLFSANLPTEEVFTLPHREQTEGVLRGTRPISYAGGLIEDFTLEFHHGKAVKSEAAQGRDRLKQLLATDEGAVYLGEVALVPRDTPLSQLGQIFYHPLLDENAACHVALGQGYPSTVNGGESMSARKFTKAGGNHSLLHVDLMIGSDSLDVDGVWPDGRQEPLMRAGAWAGVLAGI